MAHTAATNLQRDIVSKTLHRHSGNAAMFWSMAYKVTDALMLLANGGALARLCTEPASALTLAQAMGWQAEPLEKILEVLVRASVLEVRDSLYQVPAATVAVLPLIVMESQVRQWHASNQSLSRMVEHGIAANPLGEIREVSYLGNYQDAMAASSRALALHLFRHGGLPRNGHIVDIGGADGAVVEQLAKLMPGTSFTVIDREPVAPHFRCRMAGAVLPGRFDFVADDVTAPAALFAVVAKAEAVIVSNLIHLLSATQIRALFAALKSALPRDCRVLVYDQFIDPGQFDAASLMVIDWVNLGSHFDLGEDGFAHQLAMLGYADTSAHRFPLLPGALVCARVP